MSYYDEITVNEAERIIAKYDPLIIDTREAFDYRKDHIDGAMQGHGDLIQHLISSQDFDRTVLVYCYRGTSSKELAEVFGRAGFSNVFSMAGGFTAWKKRNYLYSESQYSDAMNQWLSFQGFERQSLNTTITNQMTPLMVAARDNRDDIVAALIEHGADLNLLNSDGNNALWLACFGGNESIIRKLIDSGINIDQQNKEGATALIYSASAGKTDVVRILLEAGADTELATKDDFRAIDIAANAQVLKLLKESNKALN